MGDVGDGGSGHQPVRDGGGDGDDCRRLAVDRALPRDGVIAIVAATRRGRAQRDIVQIVVQPVGDCNVAGSGARVCHSDGVGDEPSRGRVLGSRLSARQAVLVCSDIVVA